MSENFGYNFPTRIENLFAEIKHVQNVPCNFYAYVGTGTQLRVYREENNVYVEYPPCLPSRGLADSVKGKDLFEAGLEKIIKETCDYKFLLLLWGEVWSRNYSVSKKKRVTITIHCRDYSSYNAQNKKGNSFSYTIKSASTGLLNYLSTRYPKEEGDSFISVLWNPGERLIEPTTEELICWMNENKEDAEKGIVRLPKEVWQRYFQPQLVLSWKRTEKEDEEDGAKLREDIFAFLQDNFPYRLV